MKTKTFAIAAFIASIQFSSESIASTKNITAENIPDLEITVQDNKLDCAEFKPNLITKFLWREGPTRGLLYKKCLEQTQDDKAFNKYNSALVNDSNISDLMKDITTAQTRLTILTLTTALKDYLTDPETDDDKTEMIKNAVAVFKTHYLDKKAMIDVEIKNFKKKENKKGLELISIIEENEADLGNNIELTIKYIEFVLKDRHAYVAAHNKFFPKFYENNKIFRNQKLSKYECDFLKIHFGENWTEVKSDLNLSCKSI